MQAAALHACEFTSTSPAKFAGNHHDNNVFIGRLPWDRSVINRLLGDTPPFVQILHTVQPAHAASPLALHLTKLAIYFASQDAEGHTNFSSS